MTAMIQRLAISGFQSLYDVEVDLEPFTVLVGPSGSGKSAVFRSLRALASNVRGTSAVSTGRTNFKITAVLEDSSATLERGDTQNKYTVTDASDKSETFTKLGGAVPEAVTSVLGIPVNSPLTFSGQFDKPYLLDESGSQVARTLGELTNVTRIFEAAREGSRRKLAEASVLKLRKQDLADAQSALEGFADLDDKLTCQAKAELLVRQAENVQAQVTRLKSLLETIDTSRSILATLPKPVPLPDVTDIEKKRDDAFRLRALLDSIPNLQSKYTAAMGRGKTLQAEEKVLSEKIASTLRAAKVCPTCGGSTEHVSGKTHA